MSEKTILTSKRENALIITLNRPEKRNALTFDMMWSIQDAIDLAATDGDVRIVIIHGEGKCFSAGIDIASLAELGQKLESLPAFRHELTKMQGVFNKIENLEKPVIAALHNQCLGMGMELALAADFRIAAEDTAFAMPEVELGLIPDVGGTSRLTRIIGPALAKELIVLCRRIGAKRAYDIGLVNEVVADGAHLETAAQWAENFKSCAPLAAGIAKKIINRGAHLDLLSLQELEAYAQSTIIKTEDVREGLMAKLQKRKPDFKGK